MMACINNRLVLSRTSPAGKATIHIVDCCVSQHNNLMLNNGVASKIALSCWHPKSEQKISGVRRDVEQ